jgi:predicted RNA binding protein YcfA (HicA-like mRNA interferase family)
MSPSLPILSGREVVRAFESLGWLVARQSGSHIIMVKESEMTTLSIPAPNSKRDDFTDNIPLSDVICPSLSG